MDKETKEHLIFGGGILAVGIAFLYAHNKAASAPPAVYPSPSSPAASYSAAAQAAPSYPSASEVTPGAVDIRMGGSPVYQTYNMPGAPNLTPPQSPAPQQGCGGGCNDCPGQQFVGGNQYIRNNSAAMEAAYQSMISTGLINGGY